MRCFQEDAGVDGVVEIDGDVPVVGYGCIDTEAGHVSLLPTEVEVGLTLEHGGAVAVVLCAQGEGVLILECGNVVVTGLSVTCAEFQEGNGREALHEVLLGDNPCGGNAGEPAAAVVGTEFVALVVTDGGSEDVLAHVGILGLPQDRPGAGMIVGTGVTAGMTVFAGVKSFALDRSDEMIRNKLSKGFFFMFFRIK